MSILLYASETWTLLAADIRRLEAFDVRRLRQLLNIIWRDHVTNAAILVTTGLMPLQDILSNGEYHCLVMLSNSSQLFMYIMPYRCRQTSPLVGSPTPDNHGHLVDHERLGVARSRLTSECLLLTTGTAVSSVARVE